VLEHQVQQVELEVPEQQVQVLMVHQQQDAGGGGGGSKYAPAAPGYWWSRWRLVVEVLVDAESGSNAELLELQILAVAVEQLQEQKSKS
jgi:hypothetical protein